MGLFTYGQTVRYLSARTHNWPSSYGDNGTGKTTPALGGVDKLGRGSLEQPTMHWVRSLVTPNESQAAGPMATPLGPEAWQLLSSTPPCVDDPWVACWRAGVPPLRARGSRMFNVVQ